MGGPLHGAKLAASAGAIEALDDDDASNTFLHQILMVFHLIVAVCVFGVLGHVFNLENNRMRKLRTARDGTPGVVRKRSSEEDVPVIQHPPSYYKKLARKFAAEYALYRVDYFLSTASFAKPLLLLLLTYIIIILGGFVYSYLSGIPMLEALWLSWTMVADPGAHSGTPAKCSMVASRGLTTSFSNGNDLQTQEVSLPSLWG